MVLFIWNLLRHAWGAKYIYKTRLLSLPLGTTGVSSPPWVHMGLQMSLLEIKHSHHETFPNLSCAFYLEKEEVGEKHNPTKLPHSFAALIVVLWMRVRWKQGKNCKYFCGSCSKILQEICVSTGGLRPSGVCGKIHLSMLWIKPLIQKCVLTDESLLVHGCKV